MLSRRRFIATVAAAAASAPLARTAFAQNFPTKPVQLIVAFPPGGSTDIGARIVASIAEKELGQPIVVVNKGGAGGQIGWTDLARARPDGYTIGLLNLPATNTTILDPERKAIFTLDSFIPLINQVLDPGLIWVKGDGAYKSLADLVDAAKKSPGKISACTTGILSDDHLAILMLQEAAGVEFRIVHFDGGAQQVPAVLGGHVDCAFDNVGGVFKRVLAGEVRGLATLDTERSKFLPDVPTTVELGYKTVISSSTRGIAAPKGTPPAAVAALTSALRKAIENPDHVAKMDAAGLAIRMMVGPDYEKYCRENYVLSKKYTEWALKQR